MTFLIALVAEVKILVTEMMLVHVFADGSAVSASQFQVVSFPRFGDESIEFSLKFD